MPTNLHMPTTWSMPSFENGEEVPEMVNHTPRVGSGTAYTIFKNRIGNRIIIITYIAYHPNTIWSYIDTATDMMSIYTISIVIKRWYIITI